MAAIHSAQCFILQLQVHEPWWVEGHVRLAHQHKAVVEWLL